jgi:hypothetical protein
MLDRVYFPAVTQVAGDTAVGGCPRTGGEEACQDLHGRGFNLGLASLALQQLVQKYAVNWAGQPPVLPVLVEPVHLYSPEVLCKKVFDEGRRENSKVNGDPLALHRLAPDGPSEELERVI